MTNIVVSAEVWRENVGGYDPDDPWSRDSTVGGVSGATARTLRDGEDESSYFYGEAWQGDLDAKRGDMVYAVIVGYTTGDTFGTDGGNAEVVDVFADADREKAYDLADAIEGFQKGSFGQFESHGKEYYYNWSDYFGGLDSVHVYPIRVGR